MNRLATISMFALVAIMTMGFIHEPTTRTAVDTTEAQNTIAKATPSITTETVQRSASVQMTRRVMTMADRTGSMFSIIHVPITTALETTEAPTAIKKTVPTADPMFIHVPIAIATAVDARTATMEAQTMEALRTGTRTDKKKAAKKKVAKKTAETSDPMFIHAIANAIIHVPTTTTTAPTTSALIFVLVSTTPQSSEAEIICEIKPRARVAAQLNKQDSNSPTSANTADPPAAKKYAA